MSDIDLAKALTSTGDTATARVHYGVAQADSEDNYVEVLIDNYADVTNMYTDTDVKAGDRVRVVMDSSGRYVALALKSKFDEIDDTLENDVVRSIQHIKAQDADGNETNSEITVEPATGDVKLTLDLNLTWYISPVSGHVFVIY